LDDEEEKIILCGPEHVGKSTCAQAGQAEFSGISQPGMDRFNELRVEARAQHTAQGLKVETLLNKHGDDKGIHAPTFEQEKARRRCPGGGRQVAAAPVMNAEAVQQQFDE